MQLYEYQKPIFDFVKDKDRIALFLEMRVGKTVICAKWLKHRKYEKNLIIAPLQILSVWQNVLKSEGMPVCWLAKTPSAKRLTGKFELVNGTYLINYEYLSTESGKAFPFWLFDCTVLDESTCIKNPTAKITKNILKRCKTKGRAILSGFPTPEAKLDLVTQYLFLKGHVGGCNDFWTFRSRYCRLVNQFGKWQLLPEGSSVLDLITKSKAYCLTRKEAGIDGTKEYLQIYVDATDEQNNYTKQLKNEWQIKDYQASNDLTIYVWLSKLSSGFLPNNERIECKKYNTLLDLLVNRFVSEKVVVYCTLDCEIERISEHLENAGIKYSLITGAFEPESNATTALDFSTSKDINVLLCQVECIKMGIDLSVSNVFVYFSNSWSGEVRLQSEDRGIHPTKNDTTYIIDLLTDNSIDVLKYEALQAKKFNNVHFNLELKEKVYRFLNDRD